MIDIFDLDVSAGPILSVSVSDNWQTPQVSLPSGHLIYFDGDLDVSRGVLINVQERKLVVKTHYETLVYRYDSDDKWRRCRE
jgi:hypothetical protein